MEGNQPRNLRDVSQAPKLTTAEVAIELLQLRQAAEATIDPQLRAHYEAIETDYRTFYPEAFEE